MAAFIRIMLTVFSGIGLGEILQKFFPDKVQQPVKSEGGFLRNAAIFAGLAIVGTMIVKFIVKAAGLSRQIRLSHVAGFLLTAFGVYMMFNGSSEYGLAILVFTAPGGVGAAFTFNMNYLPEKIIWNDGGNPLLNLRIETQEDGVLHDWTADAIDAMNGFLNVGALAANTKAMPVADGHLPNKQVTISGTTAAVGAVPFMVSSDNRGTVPFNTSLANVLPGNDTEFSKFSSLFLPNVVAATDRVQVFYKDGHVQIYDARELAAWSAMYQQVGGIIVNNLPGYIDRVVVTSALGGLAYVLRVKL
jgi:hypothetical protein